MTGKLSVIQEETKEPRKNIIQYIFNKIKFDLQKSEESYTEEEQFYRFFFVEGSLNFLSRNTVVENAASKNNKASRVRVFIMYKVKAGVVMTYNVILRHVVGKQ